VRGGGVRGAAVGDGELWRLLISCRYRAGAAVDLGRGVEGQLGRGNQEDHNMPVRVTGGLLLSGEAGVVREVSD
jgi:hypothetical protein